MLVPNPESLIFHARPLLRSIFIRILSLKNRQALTINWQSGASFSIFYDETALRVGGNKLATRVGIFRGGKTNACNGNFLIDGLIGTIGRAWLYLLVDCELNILIGEAWVDKVDINFVLIWKAYGIGGGRTWIGSAFHTYCKESLRIVCHELHQTKDEEIKSCIADHVPNNTSMMGTR